MKANNVQSEAERQKQMRAAEELLFTGPQELGIAKGIFLGRFVADWVMPYPTVPAGEREELESSLTGLRRYLDEHLDPAAIDRQADIPREVIDGLARLGVFGMTAPKDVGGRGLSQMAYCKVMEEIGGRCASTSIFVNVQHSIGMRALLLFGTPQQQRRWLPPLVRGEQLAAFTLTEPEAGSDAANVQTTA
ncbi:MAG TPA: acyl-CoA dehydrogenase family protein, partial [Verrucomicrobiae bacterium]